MTNIIFQKYCRVHSLHLKTYLELVSIIVSRKLLYAQIKFESNDSTKHLNSDPNFEEIMKLLNAYRLFRISKRLECR